MTTQTITRNAPPSRSRAQRFAALEVANAIRSARATLKEGLTVGARSIYDVLDDPPDYASNMKVDELLLALPGLGPTKTYRMMRAAEMSPRKTLGGATRRQRTILQHELLQRGI